MICLSLGNRIGVLPAHDSDENNTLNSLLTYTLLNQTPTYPSEKMFTIDQVSGEIKVANQNFQRNKVSQYELTFRVTDQGKCTLNSKWTENYHLWKRMCILTFALIL